MDKPSAGGIAGTRDRGTRVRSRKGGPDGESVFPFRDPTAYVSDCDSFVDSKTPQCPARTAPPGGAVVRVISWQSMPFEKWSSERQNSRRCSVSASDALAPPSTTGKRASYPSAASKAGTSRRGSKPNPTVAPEPDEAIRTWNDPIDRCAHGRQGRRGNCQVDSTDGLAVVELQPKASVASDMASMTLA